MGIKKQSIEFMNKFKFILVVLGASGIVAQLVLLREFLVSFQGNELSMGVFLANWLLWEFLGAYFGGRISDKTKVPHVFFTVLTLLFLISFPVTVLASRNIHSFFPIMPGQALGVVELFISSIVILLPVSICHGALFAFGCKSYEKFAHDRGAVENITSVYIYETVGSIVGGLVLTIVLIPFMGGFYIALFVGMFNIVAILLMINWVGGKKSIFVRIASLLLILLLLSVVFATPIWRKIDHASLGSRFHSQELLYSKNSRYSHLAVTRFHEQLTLYSDGIPMVNMPAFNIVEVEEKSHFPMLFHPSPKNVLMISSAAGGYISEVLKHGVESVDYTELDPAIITTLKKFPTEIIQKEFSDPRVNIITVDGRNFVKNVQKKYDVIILGLREPSNLQLNRFYTKEFFRSLRDILRPDGVVSFSLSGSGNYMPQELKKLNASVIGAVETAFEYVRVLPGQGYNLFFASQSSQLLEATPQILSQRLEARGVQTSLINSYYIDYRLLNYRIEWFNSAIKGVSVEPNSDLRPVAVLYALMYGGSKLSDSIVPVLNFFKGISLKEYAVLAVVVSVLVLAVSLFVVKNMKLSVGYSVVTTGFSGMVFDLMIIFAFQIFHGHVYYWLGILVSFFMAGTMAGNFFASKYSKRHYNDFLKMEILLALFSLVFMGVFFMGLNFKFVFVALSFIAGMPVGAQFSLATRMYSKEQNFQTGKTAGTLYGSDLLGGLIGGMVAATAVVPVLGLVNTAILISLLKMLSFVVVFTTGLVRGK